MKRKFFLNFLFFFLTSVSGSSLGAPEVLPLNIQEIEKQALSKVEKALSILVAKDDYIVDVKIVKKKSASKAKTDRVKVSDDETAQNDYLLFRKLGLEVLVNDEEMASPLQAKESLASISIHVYLDESLPQETKDAVKAVLEKLNFNFEVSPKIEVSGLKLAPKEKPAPPLLELLSKFSNSLGFIVATFILSLVLMILFSKYSKLSQNTTSAMIEAQKEVVTASSESSVSSTSTTSENAEGGGGGFGGSIDGSMSNDLDVTLKNDKSGGVNIPASVNRFKTYYKENEKETISLLKKWIKLNPKGSSEALQVLAQEVEPEILMKVFNSLSSEERKSWKRILASLDEGANTLAGAAFIDEQILEEIIVPTDLITEETKALLYELDPETCANLIVENPDLGPLLMNTLATSFIVKVMPRLEPEVIERLTMESVSGKAEDLKQKDEQLRSKIMEYRQEEKSSPFSDKIAELLPHIDLEKEDFFFKAFAQMGSKAKMLNILKAFMPAKMIPELPDEILKTILNKVPQQLLFQTLAVTDEALSSKYLNIVAPEGGKKREMFDVEIKNITANEINLAKIKKNKSAIESDFIGIIRQIVKRDSHIQEEVAPALEKACDEYLGNSTGEQNAAA